MGEKVESLMVKLAKAHPFIRTPVVKVRYVSEGNTKPVYDRRQGERRRRDRRRKKKR